MEICSLLFSIDFEYYKNLESPNKINPDGQFEFP